METMDIKWHGRQIYTRACTRVCQQPHISNDQGFDGADPANGTNRRRGKSISEKKRSYQRQFRRQEQIDGEEGVDHRSREVIKEQIGAGDCNYQKRMKGFFPKKLIKIHYMTKKKLPFWKKITW